MKNGIQRGFREIYSHLLNIKRDFEVIEQFTKTSSEFFSCRNVIRVIQGHVGISTENRERLRREMSILRSVTQRGSIQISFEKWLNLSFKRHNRRSLFILKRKEKNNTLLRKKAHMH